MVLPLARAGRSGPLTVLSVRPSLLVAILLGIGGCAAGTERDTLASGERSQPSSSGVATTMAARFAAMPADDAVVTDIDWYRPIDVVRGASEAAQQRDEARRFGGYVKRLDGPAWATVTDLADQFDTLALVVLRDGRVVFERYAPGFGVNSRFDTQSMHRALVALAVLAAHEEGLLPSLDAPVSRWLDAWSHPEDPRALITLRDLLLGQSGLIDPPYANTPDSPGLGLFIGTELRALTLAQRPDRPRAIAARGSALDAQILGLVLETVANESYASYVSRRLWQPLQAADAAVRLDREGGSTRTFCCLQARARDWARLGELVRTGGMAADRRILTRASIETLLTPSPLNKSQGMHWLLEPVALVPRSQGGSEPRTPPKAFASRGIVYAGGRGGQRLYVLPNERAVVVRIGRIRNDFDDGHFLNPIIAALSASSAPTSAKERR